MTLTEKIFARQIQAGTARLFEARVQELTTQITNDVQAHLLSSLEDQGIRTDVTATGGLGARRKALRNMFHGTATYGNDLTRAIVNFIASLTWSRGVSWTVADPSTGSGRTNPLDEFVTALFEANNLDGEGGLDLGLFQELDGQVLFSIQPWEKSDVPYVTPIPLLETGYEVVLEPSNYRVIKAVEINGVAAFKPEEVVFVKFNTVRNANFGVPTCLPCVNELEDLDKAKADLRRINHLFASPTPLFNVKNPTANNATIAALNWKIGKAFSIGIDEKFAMVSTDAAGAAALLEEMTMLVKIISGTTQMPAHFLGWGDIMSNRSTAETYTDAFSPVIRMVQGFQSIWAGKLRQLVEVALRVQGIKGLDARDVVFEFPQITDPDLYKLIEAWSRARALGDLSRETYLQKIGITDPAAELEKIQTEEDAAGYPEGKELEVRSEKIE